MTDTVEQLESIRPLIRKIVWERVGVHQSWLIDDAEQEAMIAAWERLDAGHPVGIAVYKARQAVLDVVRGRRATGSKEAGRVDSHHRAISLVRPGPDGEDSYVIEPADHSSTVEQERFDARDALREALAALPARDREIIHATFYEGLSRAEVGERYGVSHQAISIRLKRAYEKIRDVIAA